MSRYISSAVLTKNRSNSATLLCAVGLPGLLVCLGMLLKPFYILPSGSFQLGDAALVLAFVAAILHGRGAFRIEKIDFLLVLFVTAVLIINLSYFCVYRTSDFVVQSFHYVFNLLAVLTFRQQVNKDDFLRLLSHVLRLDLVIQILVYFSGMGRWFDTGRYMGTFNDPNQLAFFAFCAYLIILIVDRKRGIKAYFVDDLMAAFLIFQSASTGMLLGFLIVVLPRVVQAVGFFLENAQASHTLIVLLASVLLLALIAAGIVKVDSLDASLIAQRVEAKASAIANDGADLLGPESSLLTDRQLDKLVLYPEYLLYGAGQGQFVRFADAASANEIHSSFPAMWFCYGIVPFLVLMCWVVSNFRSGSNDKTIWLYYLGFIVETFTLANQRQPLFWFLFVLAALEMKQIYGRTFEQSRGRADS